MLPLSLPRSLNVTLLASLAGLAMAADEAVWDIRLGAELIPGLRTSTAVGGGTDDTTPKEGGGLTLGGQYVSFLTPTWGWVAGGRLFAGSSRGSVTESATGRDLKESHYGWGVNGGIAYRITPQVHVELTPCAGIGRDRVTVVGGLLANGDQDASGTGTYADYGVTAAAYYTVRDRYQIGVNVGFESVIEKAGITQSGPLPAGGTQTVSVNGDTKGHGLIAGISLGYRF